VKTPALLIVSAALIWMSTNAPAQNMRSSRQSISYHSVDIQGLSIFYREAGPANAPTVLLLHGFPSSSRMWEPLLPLLADKYHLIAPTIPASAIAAHPPVDGATAARRNAAASSAAEVKVVSASTRPGSRVVIS
jgi:hypothetical protein